MAITVTPLAGTGARGDDMHAAPMCQLLELDGARVLLDVGSRDWDGQEDYGYEKALKELAPTIDLVLISHASSKHSGMYAYAYTHYGLRCPAYCSLPVKELGRLTTLEDIIGWRGERRVESEEKTSDDMNSEEDHSNHASQHSHTPTPTREENRAAWAAVKDIRYHQPQHLYGKLRGVTITAYAAGHTLGGTLRKLRAPSAGTILYAVGVNHMRERHLDGTALVRGGAGLAVHEQLVRPGLVITDSERGACVNAKRKDRDAMLLDVVNTTLQSGHSLLLPCDPTTRILELLVLLDQHWTYMGGTRPPLCLVSNTGGDMLKFVRGLMEFFGGATAAGDSTLHRKERERGVLDFKTLNLFTSVEALEAAYPATTPKLVLAVPFSMSYGSSRRLFRTFADTPGHAIVLTNRGAPGSLARDLFDKWDGAQEERWGSGKLGRVVSGDWRVHYTQHSKVPLLGEELAAHQNHERHVREQEAARQAADSRRRRMMEADAQEQEEEEDEEGDSEKEDSDGEEQVGQRDALRDHPEDVQQVSFDIYLKGHSTHGATSFFKTAHGSAPRFRMFPFADTKRKMDSYGEVIDAERWMSRGREMERQAAEIDLEHEAKRRKMEEEADATPAEPPSKYISEEVDVDVRCQVVYIDMEGLNDSRAIKNIMPRLNPRKVILVGGTENSSTSLITSFNAISAMTKDIYVPDIGEAVKIGEHTHSYTFTVSDSLIDRVRMAPFEDFVVGHAVGRMRYHGEALVPTFEVVSGGAESKQIEDVERSDEAIEEQIEEGKDESMNVDSKEGEQGKQGVQGDQENTEASTTTVSRDLTPHPEVSFTNAARAPTSLYIGDMKLTSLKAKLGSYGLSAEFGGEGVLICWNEVNDEEGAVAISKTPKGELNITSSLMGDGDIYYTVRDAVYGMHAVIEGG